MTAMEVFRAMYDREEVTLKGSEERFYILAMTRGETVRLVNATDSKDTTINVPLNKLSLIKNH